MMRVDVIILSWNRLDDTLHAIASARAQHNIIPQVIVVDQGSDSEVILTLRQLAQKGDIHLIENGQNMGIAAGRNIGMRAGDAPYICAIDSDAIFADENQLARAVAVIESSPQVGILGFDIRNYTTNDHDWVSWAYPHAQRAQADSPFITTRFCGAGHFIRREAYHATRGYDDALFFMWEELELSYQIIEAGYQIRYSPEVCVRHKLSPNMRSKWRGERYYYFVRHRLYVDYKYLRSWGRWARYALGYLIKSSRHYAWRWAWRGIWDSRGMIKHIPPDVLPLSEHGRAYIRQYDWDVRGNLWSRLKNEVLRRL